MLVGASRYLARWTGGEGNARVLTGADEVALRRLIDSGTFSRGVSYAEHGAVLWARWEPSRLEVHGAVQGSDPEPYAVSVRLGRALSGELTRFRSSCTCPISTDCKHGVALLLADEVAGDHWNLLERSDRRTPGGTRARGSSKAGTSPRWEAQLQGLIAPTVEPESDAQLASLGLQFELVGVPGTKHGPDGPSIVVRPVRAGRNGAWSRSGITWSSLEYLGLGWSRAVNEPGLRLMKELFAIGRFDRFRYGDDVIRLERINSRRLWDLLADFGAHGIPLVVAGKDSPPLDVLPTPLEATLDVVRVGPTLRVGPRFASDDGTVARENALLLGRPSHGVAWWVVGTGTSPSVELRLAPLSGVVAEEGFRQLVASGGITIPASDESRFLDEALPRLLRRLRVTSSDGSVELPEPGTGLLLTCEHGEQHTLRLSWSRGVAGGQWGEPLWGAWERGVDPEAALIAAVESIAPELRERTIAGVRLASRARLEGVDTARFLTEVLPQLEAIEGVSVEHVGDPLEYKATDATPVVHLDGSSSPDRDWFDLTVQVTVDGERVPFSHLFIALAERRRHLILPSGTYFTLDRPEFERLAALIEEARGLSDVGGDGAVRVSRFQSSLWDDISDLGELSAQATAWTQSVVALSASDGVARLGPPPGVTAQLRPYQQFGYEWLSFLYEHRLGGILADDMGLGKTLQAISLISSTKEQAPARPPFLVVTPTSVVGNWVSECHRFGPGLRAMAVTETERKGTAIEDLAKDADVVITSYSLFRLDYERYADVEWSGLFLDESQHAKNRRSQAYRCAKAFPVPFKVAMTGTPLENNLMELWAQLSITAPGLFPSADHFAAYYQVPIERSEDPERLTLLRTRVRPLMLRRTKEEVASDLPEKQEQVLEVELAPRHRRLYQLHLQRERQRILGLLDDVARHRIAILRSLTVLRQLCLDASLVDPDQSGVPSSKLDVLMEMLEDVVADGHRVLVFSQFTRFLAKARARLAAEGIEYCYLDGRTRDRPKVIAKFREGDAPVFLISLKAGGFGLNLTEADYCILLDPWWNPATETQAIDRAHRIGQERKVMVYRLVAKDTIEERVMALKERKAALFAGVMDQGGFASSEMSAEDIRGLLT